MVQRCAIRWMIVSWILEGVLRWKVLGTLAFEPTGAITSNFLCLFLDFVHWCICDSVLSHSTLYSCDLFLLSRSIECHASTCISPVVFRLSRVSRVLPAGQLRPTLNTARLRVPSPYGRGHAKPISEFSATSIAQNGFSTDTRPEIGCQAQSFFGVGRSLDAGNSPIQRCPKARAVNGISQEYDANAIPE